MKEGTGLTISGALLLIAAVMVISFGGIFVAFNAIVDNPKITEDLEELYEENSEIWAKQGIESFEEFKDSISNILFPLGIVTLIQGVIILLGSIFAFIRKIYILPMVGAIMGILNITIFFVVPAVLSIVALYLTWKEKDLFVKPKPTGELKL